MRVVRKDEAKRSAVVVKFTSRKLLGMRTSLPLATSTAGRLRSCPILRFFDGSELIASSRVSGKLTTTTTLDLLKGNLRFDLKDLTSKSSLKTLCTVLFPSPLAPGEPSPSC